MMLGVTLVRDLPAAHRHLLWSQTPSERDRGPTARVCQERLGVLGELAGGVGHELRDPPGAISNAACFLNLILEEPEPAVKETLEIVRREVARSERIVGGLLDFGRLGPPMRREVHVNDVIQSALSRIAVPEDVQLSCTCGQAAHGKHRNEER